MTTTKYTLKECLCDSMTAIKASLTVLFILNASNSFAEYRPSQLNEQTIETITVNADGSNEQIIENTTLIETEKGVEDGQQDLSYISTLETVEVIEAYTLQADGQKIKVPADAIRTTDDPISSGAPMFSDTKHKIIIFPDVKVGSRLYFKFKTVQHTPLFKGQFFQSRFFSPHFRYGDYQINLIVSDKIPVQVDAKGVEGKLIKTENHQKFYHYSYKQDFALPPEASEVEYVDFSPYFLASSFKDQIDLGAAYQVGAHPKALVTPAVQQMADTLTKGIVDKRLQAKAVYNWVTKNIRYVAVYLGSGGVVPHDADSILKNMYGDCKDHATILESLLRAKGIESSPALINLGDAFKLPSLAVMTPQNHVINYLPEFDLYLDSTAQFAPFGTLPRGDLDKPVILTALNRIGHTPLMHAEDNVLASKTIIKINEDGSMSGTSHNTMKGTTGINYRAAQYSAIGADDEQLVKSRLSDVNETGSGTILASDPQNLDKPFEEHTTFKLDPISNFPGPSAMTNPMGLSPGLLAMIARRKPKDAPNFPFSCSSSTITESYLIEFPNSTKVTRIPSNVKFELDGFNYSADYKLTENKLEVLKVYKKQYSTHVCLADDTKRLKALFKVMQRDMMNQVFYE